jgi:hypothetical protein
VRPAVDCKDEARKQEDFVCAVEPHEAGWDGNHSAIGWMKGREQHEQLDPNLMVEMNVNGHIECHVRDSEDKLAHVATDLVATPDEVGCHELSEVGGVLVQDEAIQV